MFYQQISLLLLLSVISITFTSEKMPISKLRLFPNSDFQDVSLGHPYHKMTNQEKKNSVYLQEGCYTIFDHTQEGACALVGPLSPCQLLCLSLNKQTIVAHLCAQSNLPMLLAAIKEKFFDYNPSKVTGELFTVTHPSYDEQKYEVNKERCSYKQCYEGRTQIEELKHNKDQLINIFDIQDRNQIKAYKFNSKKKAFELGDYECAEVYVLVKIINEQATIFNTCPLAENYFGNFSYLPLEERFKQFCKIRKFLAHPFFDQPSEKQLSSSYYGSLPFVYIRHQTT